MPLGAEKRCMFGEISLKVAITAPPVEGRANKSITQFFAKLFSVPKKDVILLAGEQSRFKTLVFSNLSGMEIKEQLLLHFESQ